MNLDDPLLRGIPSAGITGYVGTGETFANPRLLYENPDLQLHTVLNLTGHSLRFGAEAFRRRTDFFSVNARNQGSFSFTGLLSGNAFADFMLGLPDQTGRIPNVARASLRQRHFHAYAQDDWHVGPKLTINAGLRYEYAGSTEDDLGIARNLNIETLQLFPEPGESGPLHDAHHDFAPRLSATYRLDDDTVVRGGYGHYITQPTMANVSLMFRNPPFNREDVFNTVRTNPTLTLANGFPEGGLAGSTLDSDDHDDRAGLRSRHRTSVECQRAAAPVAGLGRGSRLRRFEDRRISTTPGPTTRHLPAPAPCRRRRPNPDVRRHPRVRHRRRSGVQRAASSARRISTSTGLNVLATYT